MKLAGAVLVGALAASTGELPHMLHGSTIDTSADASSGSADETAGAPPTGVRASRTEAAFEDDLEGTFELIFAAEAGRWRGSCVARGSPHAEEIAADFTITWDPASGHRFEGHYGDQRISGRSHIDDDARIDLMDDGADPRLAHIESAHYRAADDYRYVLREDGTAPRRSTITRLGRLQVNLVEAIGADPRPLRICSYRLEAPDTAQPAAASAAIPADSSAACFAASRS